MELTSALASRFARTALGHVTREYPNKLDHVLDSDADARTPRELHPAFYGSFDWHSCVHSWWMLLTLRRLFPEAREADETASLAGEVLSEANLAQELAYARRPSSTGFERPYGWGWLLYLHHEAALHEDEAWGERLEPLALLFAAGFRDYLGKLSYPITVGTHFNTAFALTLTLDWADRFDVELRRDIDAWAKRQFADLPEYRGWEPGGDEFLSPVLSVALLMSKVLPEGDFVRWFERVLPEGGWLETSCRPVSVSDASDGKMAHLDGVNLSRAWALRTVAGQLRDGWRCDAMRALAERHFAASIEAVDGHYMSSHWLASFATLALLAD
ncbi:DUF2891 domain-containing protein [Aurantiacibacter sp. MUD11]|nr:DUF2891 domain-containing protein [Aurantiacibacter sp. MUD11]WAT19363.1 DUF2891 domain-containing protein [Aurantiacibacter sp. MUD11]